MSDPLVDRIWEAVSDRVGEDLRVVTRYEALEFETRMRDDVRAQYTEGEDEDVVDDTIVKQLRLSRTEDAFKTGRLRAFVRVFEEAWVVAWTDDLSTKSGVIVSIGTDGRATMDDIDWCITYLDDEVAPLVD